MKINQSNNFKLNTQELEQSDFFSNNLLNIKNETTPESSTIIKIEDPIIKKNIEKIDGDASFADEKEQNKKTNISKNNIVNNKPNYYKNLRKKAKNGDFSEFQELNEEQLQKLSKAEKLNYNAILSLKEKTRQTEYIKNNPNISTNELKSNSINSLNEKYTQLKTTNSNIKTTNSDISSNNILSIKDTSNYSFTNISRQNQTIADLPISNFKTYEYDPEFQSDVFEIYKNNINARLNTKRYSSKSRNDTAITVADIRTPIMDTSIKQESSPTIIFSPKASKIDNLNTLYKQDPVWRRKFG